MREHQIVITLKPEQFLQVQKLAKNAGAKSMGMFVRQKLLMALGIEAAAQQASNAADIEPLVGELKRLHTELREFVNESLAMYSEGLINGSLGTPVTDQASVLVADPSQQMPTQQSTKMELKVPEELRQTAAQSNQASSKREPVAEQSSTSNALGQAAAPQTSPPSQKSFPQAFIDAKPAPPLTPLEDADDNETAQQQEQTGIAESAETLVHQLYEDEPTESYFDEQRSVTQGHQDIQVPNDSVQDVDSPIDSGEPYNDVSYAQLATEIAESGNEEDQYDENKMPVQSAPNPASDSADPSMLNDTMESTANKTFAISPRLGPIEPSVSEGQTALPQTPSFRTVERKKPTPPNHTPPVVPSEEMITEDNDPAAIRSSLTPGAAQRPAMPMRHQAKRDPLAELLSDEDLETPPKPAARLTPNNDPEQAEDESDETFDIPLSLMQRRRTLEEMNKDVPADNTATNRNANEQQSASGQTSNEQTNLNSNSANNEQSTSTTHPHHSRIHVGETSLSSPEEKPKSTGMQSSTSTSQSWTPLENPDEDTPLSGGPPPKKRQ